MTNDNITSLITTLRSEIQKKSISPENIGYLLQLIYDYTLSLEGKSDKSISSILKRIQDLNNSLSVGIDSAFSDGSITPQIRNL